MEILSLCTSAGLWDKAWMEAGHTVIPACEIMPHKRAIYRDFLGVIYDIHLFDDLHDVVAWSKGKYYDGIIGGIPCQSRSTLRSIRAPKFGDLLAPVLEILGNCTWGWAIFENVRALDIPGFHKIKMNAMNYGKPHQSRERWFTYSDGLTPPKPLYPGNVDELMAYPVVAGRIYGPKQGAVLQGWPEFADLKFPCAQLQEALADGVPRGLADAWIRSAERKFAEDYATSEEAAYYDELNRGYAQDRI